MSELDEKIARLPTWVREYIARLKQAVEDDDNLRQMRALQQTLTHEKAQYKRLKFRCDVMTEIFTAAAKGENETAKEYVARMFSEYGEQTEE